MAVKVHWFQIEPNLKEYEYQFTGLSTDEKPQDERVAANSLFLELDTGDFYYCEQAGSSSVIRTEVLEEMQFQAIYEDEDHFMYFLNEIGFEDGLDEDSYFVKYDGQVYEVNKVSRDLRMQPSYNYYGSESYSFEDYPFLLESQYDVRDDIWMTRICVPNTDEHTLEIYTEETVTTEAVWEKIPSSGDSGGGGGSTDFSPKLFVTVIPSNDSAFVLDGVVIHVDEILGIKNGHIYNTSGDSFMEYFVKTVEVGESETVTIYPTLGNALEIDLYKLVACTDESIRISSVTASNEVNCEYDLGGIIYIEDPTKDASLTVEVTFGGDN